MTRGEHGIGLSTVAHARFVDDVLNKCGIFTCDRDKHNAVSNKFLNERLKAAVEPVRTMEYYLGEIRHGVLTIISLTNSSIELRQRRYISRSTSWHVPDFLGAGCGFVA